jgi:hypothetical protein
MNDDYGVVVVMSAVIVVNGMWGRDHHDDFGKKD